MDEAKLKEIEERTAKATPGPWETPPSPSEKRGWEAWSRAGMMVAATGHADFDRANAAFVAHAREDVPALVAEVRRLRRLNATLLDGMRKLVGDDPRAAGLISQLESSSAGEPS